MIKNQPDSFYCAHYISKYLPLTENWIYKILINHKKYKPVLLSRKKEHPELFPIPHRYSLDDFKKVRQFLEILFFRLFGYFDFFKDICVERGVQIIHVHFGYHGAKMVGLKKKLEIPMVCSFYGDDAFAYKHVGKYVNLFREAEKVLVLGTYMKSELIKLGCPEYKISIHHLGIDVEGIRFERRVVARNHKLRFLVASSFVEKKGVDLAIKALSSFKDDYDFFLDIIGDGPLKSEILTEIDNSGIKNRIKLHGYKPYDYFIHQAYECHVFIQASRTTSRNNKEGTPMAIVDAMATGMAVISTKHSDIPEIVIHGENGYLAEENDLNSLKACIQKVLRDPGMIETLGIKGRAWIEKEFNARKQTLKLEEYYTELIQRKTAS